MTAARFAALARIHADAFAGSGRGWSAEEIAALAVEGRLFEAEGEGFALFHPIGVEAELLTLAVAPDAQRKGVASALLEEALHALSDPRVFLEVAADNAPAITLYAKFDFAEIGRRRGYYLRPSGARVDALILSRAPR